jgi:hypothetical protein
MVMNKKSKIALASILTVASIAAIGYAFANDPFANFTRNNKNPNQVKGNFEIFNGEVISNKFFQQYKVGRTLIAEMNHAQTPSDEQITHDFNKQYALYLEASKENFAVSDQDAAKFAQEMRSNLAKGVGSNAQETLQIIASQEKALGVTDDQFWTEIEPKAYKIAMSIGRLRLHFSDTYKAQHPGATQEEVHKAWDDYGEKLLQQASISPAQ